MAHLEFQPLSPVGLIVDEVEVGPDQIPIASRIIQIADAWVAMTAASTYQPSISRESAVAKLREGAGTQFDEQLVSRFVASLTQLGA